MKMIAGKTISPEIRIHDLQHGGNPYIRVAGFIDAPGIARPCFAQIDIDVRQRSICVDFVDQGKKDAVDFFRRCSPAMDEAEAGLVEKTGKSRTLFIVQQVRIFVGVWIVPVVIVVIIPEGAVLNGFDAGFYLHPEVFDFAQQE